MVGLQRPVWLYIVDKWPGGVDGSLRLMVGMQKMPAVELKSEYTLLKRDEMVDHKHDYLLDSRLMTTTSRITTSTPITVEIPIHPSVRFIIQPVSSREFHALALKRLLQERMREQVNQFRRLLVGRVPVSIHEA